MSNLGIKEITIPSNLKINIDKNILTLESDYGIINYEINPLFKIDIFNKFIKIYPNKAYAENNKKLPTNINCIWGTEYSLLKNKIIGLSRGYTKKLDLIGVGFRAIIEENKLILKLGYSHEVVYEIPEKVIIKCPKQDKIIIFGIDKKEVNDVASKIQLLKKLDFYKGKGILEENFKIRLKEGKKK